MALRRIGMAGLLLSLSCSNPLGDASSGSVDLDPSEELELETEAETEDEAEESATAPTVTGLEDDTSGYLTEKVWTWGCSKTDCTYRFVVSDSENPELSGDYSDTATVTVASGSGTRYLRVQAQDANGLESDTVTVSAQIDVDGPVFSGSSITYSTNDAVSWRTPLFNWTTATDVSTITYSFAVAPDSGDGSCSSTDFSSTLTVGWVSIPSSVTPASSGWRLTYGETDGDGSTLSFTLSGVAYCASVRATDSLGNVSYLYSSTWTPFVVQSAVSNVIGWWDTATPNSMYTDSSCSTAAGSGDLIGCWKDLSGQNNHGTASGGVRPTYVSSALNSLPGIRFDGTDYLTVASGSAGPLHTIGSGDFSIFLIGRVAGNGSKQWFISNWDTTGFEVGINAANTIVAEVGNDGTASSGYAGDSNAHFFFMQRSGTSYFTARDQDGVTVFTRADSITSIKDTYFGQDAGALSELLIGDIYEIIMVNGVLSGAESLSLGGYFENKWGIDVVP